MQQNVLSLFIFVRQELFYCVSCRLLFDVLPQPVARELKLGHNVPAQRFESVTVLFSAIVNFDKFTQHCDATRNGLGVVNLLNKVYRALDGLLDPRLNPEIYKVGRFPDKFSLFSKFPVILDRDDTRQLHVRERGTGVYSVSCQKNC